MKQVLLLLSWIGLALSVVPAVMYFQGSISHEMTKGLMLVGTVLWFGARIAVGRLNARMDSSGVGVRAVRPPD